MQIVPAASFLPISEKGRCSTAWPVAQADMGKKGHALRSFIGWVGGQRILAKTIAGLLPEHSCYVEPFGGAAWVMFCKDPSPVEVYNDLDARLTNLFRCVKYHARELSRELEWLLPSRKMFEEFSLQPGLTDIQRAARFFCVLRLSYGGQCKAFGTSRKEPTRFLLEKLTVDIERTRKRLERTVVEHLDFADCLHRYDSPETCFFLSPPYLACTGYDVAFDMKDHERLRQALNDVKGRWVLLYNDHEWVRSAYSGVPAYSVAGWYTLHGGPPKKALQVIISSEAIPYAKRRRIPVNVRRLRPRSPKHLAKRQTLRTTPAVGSRGRRGRRDGRGRS